MNVKIKGIDIYFPSKIENGENVLLIEIEVIKKLLKKMDIDAEEIDMIYCISESSEDKFPTKAYLVHQAIKSNPYAGILDVNGNGSGMTIALEQAMRVLSTNSRMRYVLIVGSDNDIAYAIILERIEETEVLFDTIHFIDSIDNNFSDISLNTGVNMINALIKRNHLEKEDVKMIYLSQILLKNKNKIKDKLAILDNQLIYINDGFGYTDTTSSFILLHKAIEEKMIKRGDKIILWTVGVNCSSIVIILEI